MHGTGLLLHEFGGHGLTAVLCGDGIDGYALTFFGHGQVHRAPYDGWTNVSSIRSDSDARPAMDEMLTILPLRCAFITGTTASVMRTAGFRFCQ